MELEKTVYGFDIDGVLAGLPLYKFCRRLKLDYFVAYYLNRLPLMNYLFYFLLRVNQRMAELLRRIDESGHRIVIITGHVNKDERLLRRFLKKNRIPVDKLHTMNFAQPSTDSYIRFKLNRIIEEECDLYIEDRWSLVKSLREGLVKRQKKCKIIHFRDNEDSFLEIAKNL